MMRTTLKMNKWNQFLSDTVSTSQAIYFEPKNERGHTYNAEKISLSMLVDEHEILLYQECIALSIPVESLASYNQYLHLEIAFRHIPLLEI